MPFCSPCRGIKTYPLKSKQHENWCVGFIMVMPAFYIMSKMSSCMLCFNLTIITLENPAGAHVITHT